MKKLALYVHHNPKGEVRDYIIYCLKGLQEVVTEILFIVNGSITPEARDKLEKMGIKILVRENKGFDWWAWKAGIEFYGYDKIAEYDELLLTNNTYYGPIYPFSEMWSEMDKRDCDFWGINTHRETDNYWIPGDKDSKMLEHLQSYWIVFRKKILRSYDFQNYWETLKPHRNFEEMVGFGETKLTAYFKQRGFKSSCYMDYEKYDCLCNSNPCFLTDIQVIKDRCPVIKRKYFYGYKRNLLRYGCDYRPRLLLDYLKQRNLYDTDFIIDDLLSTVPMSVINDTVYMSYILSSSQLASNTESNEKIACIVYIYPGDLIEDLERYIKNIPESIDIYIVNTNKQVAEKCRQVFRNKKNKIEFRLQPNRGRDNAALLVTCKDILGKYNYIGFVHAKKTPYFDDAIIGEEFRNKCLMSLLYSEVYIKNIIFTFEKNPKLGLLVPLTIMNGAFHVIGAEWSRDRDNVENNLAKYFNLKNVELDTHVMAAFGGMFWARTAALKTLVSYNWQYSDFPEEPLSKNTGLLTHSLERIIPHLVQKDGFYIGNVAPDIYASYYLNNLYYLVREIKAYLFGKVGVSDDISFLNHLVFLENKQVVSQNICRKPKKSYLQYFIKCLFYQAIYSISLGKLKKKCKQKKAKYEALIKG